MGGYFFWLISQSWLRRMENLLKDVQLIHADLLQAVRNVPKTVAQKIGEQYQPAIFLKLHLIHETNDPKRIIDFYGNESRGTNFLGTKKENWLMTKKFSVVDHGELFCQLLKQWCL